MAKIVSFFLRLFSHVKFHDYLFKLSGGGGRGGVRNDGWLLRVGSNTNIIGRDCKCELTFFTLRFLEHRFISVHSQILFALAFHLYCVASQGTIWCCYFFFFTLYLFHQVKWNSCELPHTIPLCASFLFVICAQEFERDEGESMGLTKVDLW